MKLVCDGYIDQLKVKIPKQKVGDLLETVDKRNSELTYTDVQGININKTFFPTVANIDESNTRNYKIVEIISLPLVECKRVVICALE